ncbi:MAG: Mrp/NBP35 family ATP-binding protein [Nitrososphaerota archaeon]|nr:Mrp/NBP35 family ATP-binding protein [Nitrososphaerota archaeon]
MVSTQEIMDALRRVNDPELQKDIVSLNMVEELQVAGDVVSFTLNLTTPACPMRAQMEQSVRQAVESVDGVKQVRMKVASIVAATRPVGQSEVPKGVKNVIAIASGKGGVGKSTVAANLAVSLAASGAKVGILDADIYGPSIPLIMGIEGRPETAGEAIIPPVAHGVKAVSLGFFYRGDTPLIWRGPMVASAVKQLLTQVEWKDLDYLVVDLPPGSGDSSLTLAQTVPLSGVVVVTTPQQAALSIASKALTMFRKLNVPILGVVENMSYFVCPHCGAQTSIFSRGGGKETASRLGAQFLGEIPISLAIREQSDLGVPIVIAQPDAPESLAFREVAFRVAGMVSMVAYERARQ